MSQSEWVRVYQKAWREKNKEKIRQYRAANKERIKESAARSRLKHRAKRLEDKKAYRLANLEKTKAQCRAWRKANPVRMLELTQAWRKANPDRHKVHSRNNKARRKNASGCHTSEDITVIFKAQKGKCAYCRQPLKKKYHVDHIVAIINGGSNDRRNLQILCERCNLQKGARDPIEHARSCGMLL